MKDTTVVLGPPVFGNDPQQELNWNLGAEEQVRALRFKFSRPNQMLAALASEYISILMALARMEIEFEILIANEENIPPGFLDTLKGSPFWFLRLPPMAAHSALSFPRDFVTLLPNGKTLISPETARWLSGRDRPPTGGQLIVSPYAEGGRIMIRRKVALVGKYLLGTDIATGVARAEEFTSTIEEAKLRPLILPNNVRYTIDPRPDVSNEVPDDHLDRICGLLEDPQHGLHLVVDPFLTCGFSAATLKAEWTHKQSLEEWRKLCHKAGVELHVPDEPFRWPMSYGFWQHESGKVLMTSGDEELDRIVGRIMGKKWIFRTSEPIRYYPVQCNASIHCLINELPDWILALGEEFRL